MPVPVPQDTLGSIVPGIPRKLFKIEFKFDKDEFPFPFVPDDLKPAPVVADTKTTRQSSRTRSAGLVNDLSAPETDKHIKTLKISDSLWDNLIHYGNPNRFDGEGNFNRNTLDVANGGEPESHPCFTAFGVIAMYAAAQSYALETNVAVSVNTQQSTRDVVVGFLLRFSQWAIMQRYPKEIVLINDARRWRSNLVREDSKTKNITGKAGRPDAILECGQGKNNAIVTAKPFWAYNREVLETIYNGQLIKRNGNFEWTSTLPSADLVRQVWGSLVSMKCTFGILTNGHEIILVVKTGPSELVISERHPWSDAKTTLAILGLTFAAIDEVDGKWADREGDFIADLIGGTRIPNRQHPI